MDKAHQRGADGGAPGTSRLLTSLVGPGVVIRGTIKDSDDTLTIRGRVEGAIEHEKHVLVDEQGSIQAEIKARDIQVRGSVTGNLHGEDRVRIDASGTVEGDIHTRRFAVEEGARMKGRVIMTSVNAVETAANTGSSARGPKPASQSTEPGTESKPTTKRSVK
jgi:cytoskeletal protein CcmA (bactofilin family)